MKAVLLSTQPKSCELIASGKKTIVIKKTKPKIETPFKVYIYETQGRKYSFGVKADTIAKHDDDRFLDCARGNPPIKEDKNGTPYFSYGRMKVIGEFVCDSIIQIGYNKNGYGLDDFVINGVIAKSCVPEKELYHYLQGKKPYLWHISNLIIYDKPKELSEFYTVDNEAVKKCEYREQSYFQFTDTGYIKNGFVCRDKFDWCTKCRTKPITRPPQPWCYVEEKEG